MISTSDSAFRKWYPNVKCYRCGEWQDSRECEVDDDWEPDWICKVCLVTRNLEGQEDVQHPAFYRPIGKI